MLLSKVHPAPLSTTALLSAIVMITLILTFSSPAFSQPVNDTCGGATAISEGVHVFNNMGAQAQTVSCVFGMSDDIWYLYTATVDATVSIGTCASAGTLLDTAISIYDPTLGCPSSAVGAIACLNDFCGASNPHSLHAGVALSVLPGESYYIQVGGSFGATGTGELTIEVIEGDCFDGLDDDGDGLFDCADVDCVDQCNESFNCHDGIDNDNDGDVDCLDGECIGIGNCVEAGVNCSDGIDNDVDGLVDCADPDCNMAFVCQEAPNFCDDGIDNDLDSLIDCDDPDCLTGGVPCFENLNCGDGIDNDLDGLVDCLDPDCLNIGVCAEAGNCEDGIDNDNDGLIDCLDADCDLFFPCIAIPVNDECSGAISVSEGIFPFNNLNTPITDVVVCDINMSHDVWFHYTPTVTGLVEIHTCGAQGTLLNTVLGVYDGALGCPLPGDTALACDDDSCFPAVGSLPRNSSVELHVVAGASYYVQVGGSSNQTGSSELIIEVVETDCSNGLDDDGDALIDCFDENCFDSPDCIVDPPTNVVCIDSGASVIVTWDIPTTGAGASGQNIYLNGVLQLADEPITTTSFVVPYTLGFMGIVEVCIQTLFASGISNATCCEIPVGGPPNDDCVDAFPAFLGTNGFTNVLTLPEALTDCFGSMSNDVWFTHTVASTGYLRLETCPSTAPASRVVVYDGGAGCPLPGDPPLFCESTYCNPQSPTHTSMTVLVTAGDPLLIQVGGSNNAVGIGFLELSEVCSDLGDVTCDYDFSTGSVQLEWTPNFHANSGYQIFENGILVGVAQPTDSSFVVTQAALGLNTYEISWLCDLDGSAGEVGSCIVNVVGQIPNGVTDLIIHNEDTSSGIIDSGLALEDALSGLGQSVSRLYLPDFDTYPLDWTSLQSIWLCLGTFPDNYRLSASEGDLLASLNAAGVGIYLEHGDHWGFQHIVSQFDARDGHMDTVVLGGNDSFTAMDALSGGVANLAGHWPTTQTYTQDSLGNDFTDILELATNDAEVSYSEVLWVNSDDSITGEPIYSTAIYAEHFVGENSIVQSWEFGGFPIAEQSTLAGAYLQLLGRGTHDDSLFIRGYCNADATLNIADAIFLLGVLFPGPQGANVPPCEQACDSNDDGQLDIADAISLLSVMFPGPGGPPVIPEPTTCGQDPTNGGVLTCDSFDPCD